MKIFLLILCLTALTGVAPACGASQRITYADPFSGFSVRLFPDSGELHQGPYIDLISVCDKSSSYLCFYNSEYWFSIPKTISKKGGESWLHNQITYCQSELHKEVYLLNDKHDIYVINAYKSGDCSSNSPISRYIISVENGLIGMEFFRENGGRESLILSGVSGFGAGLLIAK